MANSNKPDPLVESLSRRFHSIYQAEARRQGDIRHHDDYDQLAEGVKEFDRVLARDVLRFLALLEAGLSNRTGIPIKLHEVVKAWATTLYEPSASEVVPHA